MSHLRNVALIRTRTGAGRHHVILACTGLALAGLFFAWSLLNSPPPTLASESLRQARRALSASDFRTAESHAMEIPSDHHLWSAAMLVAGEAATKDGRLKDAVDYYSKVPLVHDKDAVLARFSLGEVLLHSGNLTGAEQAYRDVFGVEPGYVEAYSRLAFVLGTTGRRRESGPFLFAVLRSGTATLDELILLADIERPVNEEPFLLKCQEQEPGDVLVKLGLASNAALDGRIEDAIALLEPVVSARPELMAAQCLLGELLVESSGNRFEEWHSRLSAESEAWPDLWFVRGRWALKIGDPDMAARCFLEALNRVPLHRRANYELGIVLARLEIPAADQFSKRARDLLELSTWLTHASKSNGSNQTAMQEVVSRLEGFGRIWEACAWASVASREFPEAEWRTSVLSRWGAKLTADLPLLPSDPKLAHLLDIAAFPKFRVGTSTNSAATNASFATTGGIRFQEAKGVKFNFEYENAHDPATPGARIQEQTGGGVSVVDIDLDTWPDLYLVQGGEWKHGNRTAEVIEKYSDRLFRNHRGTDFHDVTEQTGIQEFGFGQSCGVGDVNEDGFPDLYVANIGPNCLYLNNGDGTYHKVSDLLNISQDKFTSSVAIADIDGDGLADLFDVNYVTGAEVYHLICGGRACSPSAFDGAIDQLHLSTGDGSFMSVDAATPQRDAKGLGILVAGTGDALTPSVFVANDQTPNFLLTLSKPEDGDSVELSDSALRSGLAYSQDGLVTAAMGVAADDVDNDGLIDFFVTNFQDESNCLYLQTSPGFFTDSIRSAGLRSPGYSRVGWGTQFLDADLDGELDLVVTNGHVDSYADEGTESEMSCQFFRNLSDAKFTELPSADAGEFFDRKYYGRALSKLDWNKDGLMDFVMVPIRAPVPLVTNVSTSPGHFINIRLHATTTSRDAICSRVEMSADGRVWKKQLVAGDGYHAGNERVLQFGLGAVSRVDRLVVSWPSGQQSEIALPPVDTTLELVEGRSTATAWKNESATSLPVTVEQRSP